METADARVATLLASHHTQVPKQGTPVTDGAMPRCQHCQGITDGVKITPELAEAEQSGGNRPMFVPYTPQGGNDDGDGGSGGAGSTGGGDEGGSGVDSLFDD